MQAIKQFVGEHTGVRWKTLKAELRRAAKSPEDAEAIHDLRVSIRRFVQCLRSFGDFFEREAMREVRKPLRKLMRRCGNVRNCDISIELLQGAGLAEDASIEKLRAKRAEEEAVLEKTLKRWRKRKLEWNEKPGSPEGGPWKVEEPPADNAARVLPAMFEELLAAGRVATREGAPYEEIHRFRIEGKRFRYTVELFETFLGSHAGDALGSLKALQDRLGELNDCVTALELLPGQRRARAALNKLLRQREEAFRAYWKHEFEASNVKLWTSIFSDTAKPSRGVRASKKRPARSRQKASAT